MSVSSTSPDKRSDVGNEASAIRQRMSVIRHDIEDDVDGIVRNAQELTNWKHYVRAFPWGSLAAAVAAGYMVVPRRLEVISPDADQLATLARKDRIVVTNSPSSEAKPGLLTNAANLAATAIMRAAVGYATHRIGASLGSSDAEEADPS